MALVDSILPSDIEAPTKQEQEHAFTSSTPSEKSTALVHPDEPQQISDRKLSWQSATLLLLTEYVSLCPSLLVQLLLSAVDDASDAERRSLGGVTSGDDVN